MRTYDSLWMLLTRDPVFLSQPAIAERTAPRLPIPASLPVWTDGSHSLLQVTR